MTGLQTVTRAMLGPGRPLGGGDGLPAAATAPQ
jgi:hypothetical protein